MIVVITGGTGYIGRHVAAQCLAKGWRVHLLTRTDSIVPPMLEGRIERHDVDGPANRLNEILATIAPHCVLHLASAPVGPHTPENVERLIDANIRFPVLLLEAMRASGTRNIINTGTFWQHYDAGHYWPTDFYAATKQAFGDLLRHYTDRHDISAVTLKLYDSYGPMDTRRRIVTALVDAAIAGDSLALSAGEQILDLTHVEDVAAAFVIAVERVCARVAGSDETFFVGGQRMSLSQLVALIDDRSGGRLNVRLGERPYRDREIMQPIAPVPQLPGWMPVHRIVETVDALLAATAEG